MDISLSSDALDVSFHPSSSTSLLATGLISGKVQLIDFSQGSGTATRGKSGFAAEEYGDDEDETEVRSAKGKEQQRYEKCWTVRPSNKSCRGVAFGPTGESLYTLSKDGSIFRLDSESGDVVSHWSKAHDSAPSRLLPIEENLLATGDDDGVVSLWDPRRPTKEHSAVRTYTHHFDWITSMLWCPHLVPRKEAKLTKEEEEKRRLREEKKRKRNQKKGRRTAQADDEDGHEAVRGGNAKRERLVVTSGDGTLSVIDVRAGKSGVEVSEDQEDELLSIAAVKHNSKLVVGTQLGILSLWAPSKGLLDHVDRIPGHPSSVDTMCTLDDDTILTGSSDGLVRVVQILPHKLLGIVADHGGMPVERLARRDNWLASIGHGPEIKITDLTPLLEDDEEDVDDEEGEDQPLGITSLSADVDEASPDEEDYGEGAEDSLAAYSQDGEPVDPKGGEESDESEAASRTARPTKKARAADVLRPSTQTHEDAAASSFFADL